MRRTSIVSAVFLSCVSLHVFAADSPAERRKAETRAKAEKLFGEPYTAPAGKALRLYNEQTETGPPDAAIYSHGSSFVIELVFAIDGSPARLRLFPETLLYSDSWSDVPNGVELSRADMKWLVESANSLQAIGKPSGTADAPNGCEVSGPNWYCWDAYENAVVNHYHLGSGHNEQVATIPLREISVSYKQSISGVVEAVRFLGSQRQLRVGGNWYHGEKPSGTDIFANASIGSVVQLIGIGCAGNEKACPAIPAETRSSGAR